MRREQPDFSDPAELGPAALEIIDRALAEDLASGDVTSRVAVPAEAVARARLVAKAPLVVAGLAVAAAALRRLDLAVNVELLVRDGERVGVGTILARIHGSARSILAGERTALNLLQRMSGVATLSRGFVEAATSDAVAARRKERAPCRITDTRKTMPGLRALDRYAVRCGGGHNHRNDLGAGVLIKENHIRAAGGITAAISAARRHAPHTLRIECEVTDVDELREALAAGADVVMLDNMDDAAVAEAIAITGGRALIEVSGGISEERVAVLAGLGVDLISVGKLTHSVPAADISLLFEPPGGWS
ncbi:MAG: carboxylating nicotinate-nucleotide diphosphorylase [Myxococcales bacterium]|nr:carboxylating nicotinate-nucleotide diphosphorylase [Myxococcales bacterium]